MATFIGKEALEEIAKKYSQEIAMSGAYYRARSDEHTPELHPHSETSYAVFCLKSIQTLAIVLSFFSILNFYYSISFLT